MKIAPDTEDSCVIRNATAGALSSLAKPAMSASHRIGLRFSHRIGIGHKLFGPLGVALAIAAGAASAQAADGDIRVSSIGYGPSRAKVASVLAGGTDFELRDAATDAVVFSGALSDPITDPGTKDVVRLADFSAFQTPGQYVLSVPTVGKSLPFPISGSVYSKRLATAMLGFYGWRSGMKVEFDFGGQHFHQGPGHMQDGLLDYVGSPGEKRDGSHGWYDAGDYGKYTVNTGITLGMMLGAWEQFQPQLASLSLNIPEQGGSRPDFLDELAWEYDWLFTMQYSATDGRVSHKLTSLEFADTIMPEADTTPTYYSPFGSAATASFVAAMAKGSRAFQPYDKDYAARMLTAARLSSDWLTANPGDVQAKTSNFSTGGYGTTDTDDRLWAAAELWETTGEAVFLTDLEKRIRAEKTKVDGDFDWSDVSNLAIYTYVLSAREGRDPSLLNEIQTAVVTAADTLVTNRKASGYGRSLTGYYWGVNGSVARSCMTLMAANRISPKPEYVDTCTDQVAHLYGRNFFNRSFVTGEGKDPPLHPHHRPSRSDGITPPFPGLMAGGPAIDKQCTATTTVAAKNWNDDEEDYCTNEVAINWNGALVFALAAAIDPATLPAIDPAETGGAGGTSGASGIGGQTTVGINPSSGAAGSGGAAGGPSPSTGTSTGGASPLPSSGGTSAAAASATSPEGGGCGCQVPGARETSLGLAGALGLLLALGTSRRFRRRL